ncbi:MAG: tRNA lysidine(34) synthetase TilS [Clostridia bacterium]|nr:tRNA lysidine(34) synthetase TilS [Clostridia bacterium]
MARINREMLTELFAKDNLGIYSTIEKSVRRYGMGDRLASGVLVGLSGGADSVMLLCFLIEYRRRTGADFPILCVHINHGIRGQEADRDEQFCKELCNDLSVEFLSEFYPVLQIATNCGNGVEEAARNVRYSAFRRIIQGRRDIECIAVAHNMSDNAETVIFNLLRGCGARGASGIHPVRDNIVRPLIEVSKADIVSALESASIPYVVDSTNLSNNYTRNYIRHEIISRLDRLTSDPERMLSRFAENARSDEDFIKSVAIDFLKENKPIYNSSLAKLPYAVFVRVISLMADSTYGNLSTKVIDDVWSNLNKNNFTYSLGGGLTFVCERGICCVSYNCLDTSDYCFAVGDGITSIDTFAADIQISSEKVKDSFLNVYKMSIQANLSSAIIDGSLYVRQKKDGDTVYYGGMTHKLKKLFNDRKIPVSKRGLIPIICDQKGVLWVPGFGVRDDGVPKDQRSDFFCVIGIKDTEGQRFFFGNEFKS